MEKISVTKNNGIATVVIDNPPMNALGDQVRTELLEAFKDLKADHEVVAIILTGAGERAFMAGADIKEFNESGNPHKNKPVEEENVFNFIESIPKPTIALINGYALGGGLELALTCDIRIAEEHAKFGLPEVKLGLLPGGGGTQRLPRIVGPSKAKELMFTGDHIPAEEALQLNMISKVVPKGEGMKAAIQLAEKVANHSLQALSRIKRLVNEGSELPLDEGLVIERQLFSELFETKDAKEGISAFVEKRKPVFTHE
ncbi:enoyl-CoA hydratase [Pueribacillus theae]|uniref:Enoyl-CoA hydratase n=1 Tax=Pueribacillus theae TaxID=2171751 RepID=A0A2U1JXA3_9BACI|nr:enoyl-CoA hydratase [Pueribacillus theae]PWA09438.1 enoyl-CoA hydratase [Pueribacillus theae]